MFRLLPYLIFCLIFVTFFKITTFIEYIPDFFNITAAISNESVESTNSKEEQHGAQSKDKPVEHKTNNEGESHSENAASHDPKISSEKPTEVKIEAPQYSRAELDILENLTQRRKELEEKKQDDNIKQEAISALGKIVDRKLLQLDDIQRSLNAVIKEYNDKENQKITGLVKVYENMKPKDAAKIFDELQMTVLLSVAENMKEPKLALILSQMDIKRAQEITVQLLNRRKINNNQN